MCESDSHWEEREVDPISPLVIFRVHDGHAFEALVRRGGKCHIEGASQPTGMTAVARVEIYSSDWCPYCARAKSLLAKKGVAFEELVVDGNPELRMKMAERAGGRSTVPQIVIDETAVGGASALARRDRRRLARLRLSPSWLGARTDVATAIQWAVRRYVLAMPLALTLATAGFALFFVPYWLTGRAVARVRLDPDERSTWKLLLGGAFYVSWVLALAALAGFVRGAIGGLATLALAPTIGMIGLVIRERWRGAWNEARRFFLLRSRRDLVATLRERQHALAERLKSLYQERAVTASAG